MTTTRTLADAIRQMSKKDREAFSRVMGANIASNPSRVQTVAEYIASHDVKTERRTSKRGVELIKVHYPTGVVKEYEVANISRTNAFEY